MNGCILSLRLHYVPFPPWFKCGLCWRIMDNTSRLWSSWFYFSLLCRDRVLCIPAGLRLLMNLRVTLNSRSSWRSWDYRPEPPSLTSRLALKVNLRLEEAVSGEACIARMGDAYSIATCDWALGILFFLGNATAETSWGWAYSRTSTNCTRTRI